MSVSYYADIVVGIRVKRDQLYEEKAVPGCAHQVPAKAKFCPECGAVASKILCVPIQGYDEDERYGRLDVTNFGYDNEEVIVGRRVAHLSDIDDPAKAVKRSDLTDAERDVMASLEGSPLKGKFGIWLCLSAS